MMNQETVRIDFAHQTDYQIGGVTYRVGAFFDDTENTLKGKIQRLLKDDVQKENRTLAADKNGDYN